MHSKFHVIGQTCAADDAVGAEFAVVVTRIRIEDSHPGPPTASGQSDTPPETPICCNLPDAGGMIIATRAATRYMPIL